VALPHDVVARRPHDGDAFLGFAPRAYDYGDGQRTVWIGDFSHMIFPGVDCL
jgi:hypothetical protein